MFRSVEVAMEAMEEWWAELEQYNASSNPNIIFDKDVFEYAESWSQVYATMAWGEATKIGCGIKNCTLKNTEWSVITCHYDREAITCSVCIQPSLIVAKCEFRKGQSFPTLCLRRHEEER
ncbi:unnamed protein product [Toxocara canis]|uniref:SCP domain-containing protein n=1 Tax=Toxocara canis TaxID=6265 RepID=A0A183U827_TOXCA|nr:unnamed protein product [Toxocara canis]